MKQKKQEVKKNSPGRPFGTFKYDNQEDLEQGIEDYFNKCDKLMKPYTMSGLALALNIDRRTLLNYGKNDNYFPTIKKARERCQNYVEEMLIMGKNPTGCIFNLKNNYDWVDRTEQEVDLPDTNININIK